MNQYTEDDLKQCHEHLITLRDAMEKHLSRSSDEVIQSATIKIDPNEAPLYHYAHFNCVVKALEFLRGLVAELEEWVDLDDFVKPFLDSYNDDSSPEIFLNMMGANMELSYDKATKQILKLGYSGRSSWEMVEDDIDMGLDLIEFEEGPDYSRRQAIKDLYKINVVHDHGEDYYNENCLGLIK